MLIRRSRSSHLHYGMLVLTCVIAMPAWAAVTPEEKCQDGSAVQGRNYFKKVYKAISRCEEKKAKGVLDPAVNCRPANGAVTDTRTANALARARTALDARLTAKCAGATITAVEVGEPCEAEGALVDLIDCLADDAYGPLADALIETIFDDTPALTAEPAAQGCQKRISSEAEKLARTEMTQRRKCARRLLKGRVDGTCPDAVALAKIDKRLTKFRDKLTGDCSDPVLATSGIDLGFPCDSYELTAFIRDGGTNNNLLSLTERMIRCVAAAAAGTGNTGADTGYPLRDAAPFSFGVAAGDATDTSFVVWTRTDGPGDVTLEVATDPNIDNTVDIEILSTDGGADDVVKTEVTGLSPATQYFYRFTQGGNTSRTGRVRTAPSSGGPVTFSFTGDSNAFFKPYTVLDQITAANPDLWMYIGDTIYGDDARSGSGVATVRSDYHNKYKENRRDRSLRDLMASVGTYAIWDDHEVTNDFWGTDPAIQTQMGEGNQAFRDYMPIREDGGDPQRLYRSFQWGDVAEFFLIDVRQYRSAQADVSEPRCSTGECDTTGDPCKEDADCDAFQLGQTCINFEPDLIPGDAACLAEIANPGRTYLGSAQLLWLKNALQGSTATFKFVMNGPILSSILFLPYDRWEGYAAERQDLLDFISNNTIKNVVFLSTDIHAAIVNQAVTADVRELVAGAIGMDPIFREVPPTVEALLPALPSLFPSLTYFDIDRFTVATATVTTTEATFEYRDGSGQLLQTVVIPAAP